MLQFNQRFRGGTRHLNVLAGKIEHIRGRVYRPQDAVGVEQAAFKLRFQPVGWDNLKNIALPDIVLCFFHDLTVLLQREARRYLAFQPAAQIFFRPAAVQQLRHLPEFPLRAVVFDLCIVQPDVDDQYNLLPEIIECYDLVKQHQVNIVKTLGIFGIQCQLGLGILDVVVGKIADQSAGERRETGKDRAFVLRKELTDLLPRIFCLKAHITDLHLPVDARQL